MTSTPPRTEKRIQPITSRTSQLFDDAREATEAEHQLGLLDALKLYPKAVGWSVLVSTACVMEGYDMAVIGQLFAQEAFQKAFGVPSNGGYQITASWQTALGSGGYIGVICGILLNGYITERIGMKKTLVLAYIAMTGLTFILVFGETKDLLLVGQILCGIPWGIFTATAPTYASEVCPVILRGYLTTFINMTWVIGQLISAGVFRGSPWWLLRKGRMEEAEHSLQRLSPATDTKKTLAMMIRTDEQEKELDRSSYWDCFKSVDRRRTEVALMTWAIQVFAGISMNQYKTYFFQQAGVSGSTAFDISIGYYGLGCIGTLIAWFLMTHYGRRTIFLGGLALMCITMLTIGFAALAPESNTAAMWAQSILLVVRVFLYDSSAGPLAFCIVSEVGSTRLRAKTVALGRCSFYFCKLERQDVFFYGGTCFLSLLWAYFRLPEMKGRTYEELDILFRKRTSAREFASTHVNAYDEA
ncbi:sugar transporter [Aspergillus sclerotiicarbonarius CBS 121057]|uniref:Sugar transporter n=1 Tax=Aspergillus sclerotiicarbonarius (strain CBS 121057 / IBT 28362) TaxID=1448318 RepID=A0A319E7L7_ASPSB|nr:sugar transporter [Aspergillus sclerotiicarbonarius CBS 121057]